MPSIDRDIYALDFADISDIQKELVIRIDALQKDLKKTIDRRNALGSKTSLTDHNMRLKSELNSQVNYLIASIEEAQEQSKVFTGAINVSRNVDKIFERAERANENLHDPKSKPDLGEAVKQIQQQLKDLAEENKKIPQLMAQQSLNVLTPKVYFHLPDVNLADVNLAYKYADAQSDTNIFLGIATLFLGFVLSIAVTLITSIFVSTDKLLIAVYWAVLVMGVVVTIIFGWLFGRAYQKANKAKKELRKDAEARQEEGTN